MRSGGRLAAAVLMLVMAVCAAPASASAQQITIGPDGRSAPVFDYDAAIRERVFIPQPGLDQDGDGAADRIAVEIMRPAGAPAGTVPAIVDPSPYYTTLCRGNEGECIADSDADGRNDRWPLFYDNFFVPRGYAYLLAESNGTANSTGCPLHGGVGDIAGMRSVIDWLNGRAAAVDANGTPVTAGWHNGKAAMIGKSYDGTLANGVAATGVEGLETIVPISAISDWYRYSRMNGIRFNNNYPTSLSTTVTNPARRPACAAAYAQLSASDGDETGDVTPFWDERNYLLGAPFAHAAVFATHGFQDDNVRLDHLGAQWEALTEHDVPRKLWLLRGGHVDPFDSRRAAWVDTLHRWFDHWLVGVDNGITEEPRVDIEEEKDVWQTYADWPVPGTTTLDVFLHGETADGPGSLALRSGGALDTVSWTEVAARNETTLIAGPDGAQAERRVFLSPPLKRPLQLSGTPVVDIRAAVNRAQSNLGAFVVDYGLGTQVTRNGEGIQTTTERTCWGASTTRESSPGVLVDHDACYREVVKPTMDVAQWRLSSGILDSSNRASLRTPTPLTLDEETGFSWPLVPIVHTIPAGHRLGIVLASNVTNRGISQTVGATVALDTRASRIRLPIAGGYRAAAGSGAFTPDAGAPQLHDLPADVTVRAADASGAVVDYVLPTATDDETPDPDVRCVPAPGSRFPIGTTTVTCTATDAYDQIATAAFSVTVLAPEGPPPAEPPAEPPVVPPAVDVVGDQAAPLLRKLRLQAGRRVAIVAFRPSEAARVTVTLRRKGSKRALDVQTVRVRPGKRSIRVPVAGLRAGRYVIVVRARDAAGNAGPPLTLRFRRR